jgi:hypothetical protein
LIGLALRWITFVSSIESKVLKREINAPLGAMVGPRGGFSTSPSVTSTYFTATDTKVSRRLTAINLTNKYALYNFLSTFSGAHYVTPRTVTAELGFHF